MLNCIEILLEFDCNSDYYISKMRKLNLSNYEWCDKARLDSSKQLNTSNKENIDSNIQSWFKTEKIWFCQSKFIDKLEEYNIHNILNEISSKETIG